MPQFIHHDSTGWIVEDDIEDFKDHLETLRVNRDYLRKVSRNVTKHVIDNWSVDVCGPVWQHWLNKI
jgi:hypothetical protein